MGGASPRPYERSNRIPDNVLDNVGQHLGGAALGLVGFRILVEGPFENGGFLGLNEKFTSAANTKGVILVIVISSARIQLSCG